MKRRRLLAVLLSVSLLMTGWIFPAHSQTQGVVTTLLSDCDSPDRFSCFGGKDVSEAQREENGKTSSYMTFSLASFSFASASFAFDPADISTTPIQRMALQFVLYASDKNGIVDSYTGENGGKVQLLSSDDDYFSWALSQYEIKDGFQTICLPFSSAEITGTPDLSKIRVFRFLLENADPVTVGLDTIEILAVPSDSFYWDFSDESTEESWAITGNGRGESTEEGLRLSLESGKTSLRMVGDALAYFPYNSTLLQLGVKGAAVLPDAISLRLTDADGKTAELAFDPAELAAEGITFLSKKLSQAQFDPAFSSVQVESAEILLEASKETELTLVSFGLGSRKVLLEHTIDTIGKVNCDNYLSLGDKITAAEQEVAVVAEEINLEETTHSRQDEIDYSEAAINYFTLEDARKAYDLHAADAKKGVGISIEPNKDTVAAGEEVTVKVRVKNLSENFMGNRYALTHSVLYGTLLENSDVAEGNLAIEAGEEGTLTFRFLAREGGILNLQFTLYNDRNLRMTVHKAAIQVTGAGVYLGATHSHSIESDGKGTLSQNYNQMVKDGMSLTYSTDHNAKVSNKSNLEQAMDTIKANGHRFLALKGTEITVYDNNGHMLSYGNNIDFTEPPRLRTQEGIDNWNRIIDQINSAGGYSYLAHPFIDWYNYPGFASDAPSSGEADQVEYYDDILDLYTEYTGIEIINVGYQSHGEGNLRAISYWQRMNCKGYKKYFGSANSDGHKVNTLSTAYNGFLMDDLTEEQLLDAHRNGRFFATTGPEMRFSMDGKTFGQTLLTDGDTARLQAEVYTPSSTLSKVVLVDYPTNPTDADAAYADVQKTVLYEYKTGEDRQTHLTIDQEIPVSDGHFYALEVTTSNSAMVAFGNPIWVYRDNRGDVDGDTRVNAADALRVLQQSVKLIQLELRESEMADVNRSGRIDATDALKILQKAVNLIEKF